METARQVRDRSNVKQATLGDDRKAAAAIRKAAIRELHTDRRGRRFKVEIKPAQAMPGKVRERRTMTK